MLRLGFIKYRIYSSKNMYNYFKKAIVISYLKKIFSQQKNKIKI